MPPQLAVQLSILAIAILATFAASKAVEKKHQSCKEFSDGVTFNDSQAIGTWHLVHSGSEKNKGFGINCVLFTPVTEKEGIALSERIGKFVENLKWDQIIMKMQMPCPSNNSNTRDYYLEKLEGEGSYRTLLVPPLTDKTDAAEFLRYPMHLKTVEEEYLAMMDCLEHLVFLLGKKPSEWKQLDERLQKMQHLYWPKEY